MKKLSLSGLLMAAFSIFFSSALFAQWNTNTSVNITIADLQIADMQAVHTSDGKTWVAFYNQTGSNYDMRAQLFNASGFKLLGNDGVLVSNKTSGSATFVFNVCVDANDNLVVAMQDERSGPDQAVMYKIGQNGMQLWNSDGIILGGGLAPYPALLSNGEIAVVWNESNSNTLQLQKITTGGAKAWTTPVQIKVGSANTTRGQIVGNTSGKFTIVYQKMGFGISTTLYSQMFDNSGTALYTPLQISSETTSGATYYSICAQGDTTYFGYFSSVGFRFNSYLQQILPGGTIPWGMNGSHFNTATATNDNYQMQTAINLEPGSPYVWSVCNFSDPNQNNYGIYVQKFKKSDGSRQFTDFAKQVYPITSTRNQQEGELALVNDTPMFMYYINNYKIFATRLDASGNFSWPGNQLEISSTTNAQTSAKGRFCFTPDGPNRCAGFWAENRGGGFLGYGQGVSVGGLIGINVATQGNVPAVITTQSGTLQMVDTIFPTTASQSVTWSIVPGTGHATITQTGKVTATANGTVYAKAKAVQDPTVADSVLITISGQIPSGVQFNFTGDEFVVYPVPNNGKFTIASTFGTAKECILRISNSAGQIVYESGKVVLNAKENRAIDLGSVPDGVYWLEILSDGSRSVKKIVIKK
jgi:hypothetical protein